MLIYINTQGYNLVGNTLKKKSFQVHKINVVKLDYAFRIPASERNVSQME